MSPVTHLLAGWLTAQTTDLSRRDRALVTLAGVAPDIDALGLVVELATKNTSAPLYWWSDYHHVLGHNLGFALVLVTLVGLFAVRRWAAVLMAVIALHLHLLADLVGSKGPDGYQWPIPYLLPFSDRWQLTWDGQWGLNAWPNILLTALFLAATLTLACKRGYSPLELISKRIDNAFVAALRKRFGAPAASFRQPSI